MPSGRRGINYAQEEFTEELRGVTSLVAVPRLCLRFGSSFEATVYRIASTFDGVAVAGRSRNIGTERTRLCCMLSLQQPFLFGAKSASEYCVRSRATESLHTSEQRPHGIRRVEQILQ